MKNCAVASVPQLLTELRTVIHDTYSVLACWNRQRDKKMRHRGSISKSCIFLFCNKSLFTTDFRALCCKRKFSSGRAWCFTNTNQVVKGM
jgi:hypothetical protein